MDDKINIFERFLTNQMEEEERTHFLLSLDNQPQMMKELEEFVLFRKLQEKTLQEDIKPIATKQVAQFRKEQKRSRNLNYLVVVLISLAIAFGVYKQWFSAPPTSIQEEVVPSQSPIVQLVEEEYFQGAKPIERRLLLPFDNLSNTEEQIQKVLEACNTNEFERLIIILTDIEMTNKDALRLLAVKAYGHIQLQQYDQALAILQGIQSEPSINSYLLQEIEWLNALAYILKEDNDSAITQLNNIANDDNHAYNTEAKTLLEKMTAN